MIALQSRLLLKLDGRRLGLIGGRTLYVESKCGHSGKVLVADLFITHPPADVRRKNSAGKAGTGGSILDADLDGQIRLPYDMPARVFSAMAEIQRKIVGPSDIG